MRKCLLRSTWVKQKPENLRRSPPEGKGYLLVSLSRVIVYQSSLPFSTQRWVPHLMPQKCIVHLRTHPWQMIVHSIRCAYGAFCISRATRQSSILTKEHHPRRLRRDGSGTTPSAILAYLADTDDCMCPKWTFGVIHPVPPSQSKRIRLGAFGIAEA